jgi:alpha-D-ribose 1-methylphosphonate 5-triphosphate diphosphatase
VRDQFTAPVARVVGGRALLAGTHEVTRVDVSISDGAIDGLDGPSSVSDGKLLDARGAWVLPGLVDLHGDAFERSLMTRAGVHVDPELALADNATQLLSAGVTTSFLSATDSWEPGLRSRATLRVLVETLARPQLGPHTYLHVRHECCNTADLPELVEWIESRAVRLLSFNDHTPGGIGRVEGLTPEQVQRSGVAQHELERLLGEAISRRCEGAEQERVLATVCARAECPTASHDASTSEHVDRDLTLGVSIAEFPATIDLAQRYRDARIEVLLGAPNLVRGGSHLGNLSVRSAWEAGAGDLLCSDYHYPSLLAAPFVLSAAEICSFGAAWSAVSTRAAASVGLDAAGGIAPGSPADLVIVEPPDPSRGRSIPRVRASIVGGYLTYEAP